MKTVRVYCYMVRAEMYCYMVRAEMYCYIIWLDVMLHVVVTHQPHMVGTNTLLLL
jgi:hypothetical protein